MGQAIRNSFIFEELEKAIELKVYTKSPSKWLLIDRETGIIYEGNEFGAWDRLEPVKREGE
jgi:hypothetical protein